MNLDRLSPKPLYLQLEEIIKSDIANGALQPHQQIPSENELSKQFSISRMTVRSVLTRLVNDGLLYRVPGKGTFVAEPKITTSPLTKMGIREQLEEMGYETSTVVLDKQIERATPSVAMALNIPVGSEVYALERVRFASGEPLSLHQSYIPANLCRGFFENDLEGMPLCDILDSKYGLITKKGVETLEIMTAGAREAEVLQVKKGFPLLNLNYVMFSEDGTPFEYSNVAFRGDRIKLKFESNR